MEPEEMHALFCYGSLQLPQVMQAVLGRSCLSVPARVVGYAVRCLQAVAYPCLIARPGDRAHGVLYTDLTAAELERLDRFEGQEYQRVAVSAQDERGRHIAAWVYLLDPSQHGRVQERPWSLEQFVAKDLAAFMQGFVRGRQPQWALAAAGK